ncbi:MAG TPA: ribosome small subunit-dependent GTPase A [Verrucomicrobiae bacterium]|nr:ribosome small subunit-dependent GTPase A [Verrucomicrobiae bacterium]
MRAIARRNNAAANSLSIAAALRLSQQKDFPMNLEQLGWDPFFDNAWKSVEAAGTEPGRVIAQHRALWTVAGQFGELQAEASGKLRQSTEESALWPTIGDWVVAKAKVGGGMVIHDVLPRRTQITRKIPGKQSKPQVLAANVDTLFLTMGLDGDFNVRRLERFLAQFWNSGAKPVLLLNKADVRDDAKEIAASIRAELLGVDVLCISARTGTGLQELDAYVTECRTIVLVGSSGVGKSTLVNRLLCAERQCTQTVRATDSRGRHTTTARELFFLGSGAMLIDTPGLRELQLWDPGQGLQSVFADLSDLAQRCRFRDCRHQEEPGCAVRAAIEQGDLAPDRLESYRKLQREQEFQQRKTDALAAQERKSSLKKTHREIRRYYRERDVP